MRLHCSFLGQQPFAQIHRTFLQAFADYQVDMSYLTEEVLRMRCIKNAVDYESSVGLFDGDRMVGFTLIGVDLRKGVPAAFDAGSGMVKEFRGEGWAGRMFDFGLPRLRARGVRKFLLEVIQDNDPAVKAYKKSGFHITREFDCFEWDVKNASLSENAGLSFSLQPAGKDMLPAFRESLDWEPSWENSFSAVARIPDEVKIYGAVSKGEHLGLLVYYPLLNWIMTLVVKRTYRRKGVGTALLAYFLKELDPEMKIVKLLNVDHADAGMLKFLAGAGFRRYLSQYEMERDL